MFISAIVNDRVNAGKGVNSCRWIDRRRQKNSLKVNLAKIPPNARFWAYIKTRFFPVNDFGTIDTQELLMKNLLKVVQKYLTLFACEAK